MNFKIITCFYDRSHMTKHDQSRSNILKFKNLIDKNFKKKNNLHDQLTLFLDYMIVFLFSIKTTKKRFTVTYRRKVIKENLRLRVNERKLKS